MALFRVLTLKDHMIMEAFTRNFAPHLNAREIFKNLEQFYIIIVQ